MMKRLMVVLAATALFLVALAVPVSASAQKGDSPAVAQAPCVRVRVCQAQRVCRPVCAKVCWNNYSFTKSCFSPRQCAPMPSCVMMGPCGVMVIKHRECAKCCRQACGTRLKCQVRCLPDRRR